MLPLVRYFLTESLLLLVGQIEVLIVGWILRNKSALLELRNDVGQTVLVRKCFYIGEKGLPRNVSEGIADSSIRYQQITSAGR